MLISAYMPQSMNSTVICPLVLLSVNVSLDIILSLSLSEYTRRSVMVCTERESGKD